ncbi:LysM peptidoglycan-binding domain-containing protein [Nonomuraea sp. 10N515B]|uniref:LysM peptidoglycan-binding domain-containing protein n=1 Tax=Nonomuraea sp. 10N515B TaxID=3457422 RepID=UPI003FCE7D9E
MAITVGFPWLMLSTIGSPLPDRLPQFRDVIDQLTARDDGTLFIWALELIAWGAWALFSLSVALELVSRSRGLRAAPRVRGLSGFQRLATYLVTAATLAVGVPVTASAESPSPPVVAMAPHHPLGDAPKERVYRVRQGDTLWKIADKKLGNPRRWPKIWKLNARSAQPDGRQFTDPDLIHPGWKLRLPIKKPPAKSVQERPRVVEPPPTMRPTQEQPAADVIELPSGSMVALAYAAGVSTAFVANRLLHRRRRTLPAPSDPVTILPEPEPEPAVHELRRAFRQSFAEREAESPQEEMLLREAYSIDVPQQTAIGRRDDGSLVEIDLSGPGLGLCGEGADDALRYLIVDCLRQASDFRAEIIISKDPAKALLTELPALPGLVVTATQEEALKRFNDTHFTRRRMMLEREASTIDELRERDPGEPLPAVLLVTDLNDEVYEWITAPLLSGKHTGVGALIQGEWHGGTTCVLDEEHRITHAEGRLADVLEAAQLFHITQEEAAAALRALAPPPDPASSSPVPVSNAWHGPELVRLSILGPPTVLVRDQPQPLELSWLQVSLLVYLALHPRCVRENAPDRVLNTHQSREGL